MSFRSHRHHALVVNVAALILQLVWVALLEPTAAAASEDAGYDIIVVAGQSNAVGAGRGAFSDPWASEEIDRRIFQIGRFGSSDGQVAPVGFLARNVKYDGLEHWGRLRRPTLGFGITFARRYVREALGAGRRVLIVPSAAGSTSILQWLGEIGSVRLQAGDEPVSDLYGDMTARTKVALRQPGQNRVVAFLWLLGETDVTLASNPRRTQVLGVAMNPSIFHDKLASLVARLRNDFGGNFPILFGHFVPGWAPGAQRDFDTRRRFEAAIDDLASQNKQVGAVATEGLISNYEAGALPAISQLVHFSAQSQVYLGSRYFSMWKCMQNSATEQSAREDNTRRCARFVTSDAPDIVHQGP